MSYYIFKVVITGIIVVIITETAKFNLKLAALITAMPIVTLLCIFWMYYEGMEKKEISEYVFSTLKYLIPTIPMFVLLFYEFFQNSPILSYLKLRAAWQHQLLCQ